MLGRLLLLGALAALALLGPAGTASGAGSDTARVTGWVDVALHVISRERVTPPRAARALALLSVAMDRAAQKGGGPDAVDGAAATVLANLFPARAAAFEQRAVHATDRGRAIGGEVVTLGRSDGSNAVWSGDMPAGPQYWIRTPPAYLAPVEPLAGKWRTWNIRSGAVYRPGPPPRPGSARFERELREVVRFTNTLDPAKARAALHWADGSGTETPAGHWNRIALTLLASRRLPMRAAARVLAVLNTAQADAFVATWDAKYSYCSVRPITVMRRRVDVYWSPLLATPPFPSYVSGHSATSAAASTVLARFFPGSAARLRRLAATAAISRLYAGIHFRADVEQGVRLGRRVGWAALRMAARPPA